MTLGSAASNIAPPEHNFGGGGVWHAVSLLVHTSTQEKKIKELS